MHVVAFDDVLCARAFDAVCADVRRYVDAVDAGDAFDDDDDDDDDDDGGVSLTSAFWMPMSMTRAPRNAIEAYVASLARSDWFRDHVDVDACAGAEWWIQDVAWDEPPKVYHTDCDVCVRGETSTRAYPRAASVTYVTTGGGPTAVFAQTRDARAPGTLDPAHPGEVTACAPVANRLMLFNGDRWHGVLGANGDGDGGFRGQRVTLLVNWWARKPSGARALARRFVRDDVDFSAQTPFEFGERRVVCAERILRGSYARDAPAWDAQRAPAAFSSSCCTFVYE